MNTAPVRQMIELLLARRQLVVATILATCAIGVLGLLSMGQSYQSKAVLMVKFGQDIPADMVRQPGQREGQGNDHVETLRSFGELLHGQALETEVLNQMGLERVFPRLAATSHPLDKARRGLDRKLKVRIPEKTQLIELTMNHADPGIAAEILNRLINTFIQRQASLGSNPQVDFLHEQVDAAQARLKASQDALTAFVKDNVGVTAINENVITLFSERAKIVAQLTDLEANSAGAAARADSLGKALTLVPAGVPTTDPAHYHGIDDARDRLAELGIERTQQLATHQPDSLMIKQLDQMIANAATELQSRKDEVDQRLGKVPNQVYQNLASARLTAEADRRASSEPLALLRRQLVETDAHIAALEAQKTRHGELVRQVELDEENYKFLVQRLEESQLAAGMNERGITRFAVMEAPSVPTEPSWPPTLLGLLAILAVSLAMGPAVAVAAELLDNRIRTAAQLSAQLGLAVLAVLPLLPWAGSPSDR